MSGGRTLQTSGRTVVLEAESDILIYDTLLVTRFDESIRDETEAERNARALEFREKRISIIMENKASPELIYALFKQRIINEGLIAELVERNFIGLQQLHQLVLEGHFSDSALRYFIRKAHISQEQAWCWYLEGKIQLGGMPHEALQLAKSLFHGLAQHDVRDMYAHLLLLDKLFLAILEDKRQHLLSLIDEDMEKHKDKKVYLTKPEIEAYYTLCGIIKRLLNDAKSDSDAAPGNVDDYEKQLKSNKYISDKDKQHIEAYIEFVRRYGAFYKSIKKFLVDLKAETQKICEQNTKPTFSARAGVNIGGLRISAKFNLFSSSGSILLDAFSEMERVASLTLPMRLSELVSGVNDQIEIDAAFEVLVKVSEYLEATAPQTDVTFEALRSSSLEKLRKLKFFSEQPAAAAHLAVDHQEAAHAAVAHLAVDGVDAHEPTPRFGRKTPVPSPAGTPFIQKKH